MLNLRFLGLIGLIWVLGCESSPEQTTLNDVKNRVKQGDLKGAQRENFTSNATLKWFETGVEVEETQTVLLDEEGLRKVAQSLEKFPQIRIAPKQLLSVEWVGNGHLSTYAIPVEVLGEGIFSPFLRVEGRIFSNSSFPSRFQLNQHPPGERFKIKHLEKIPQERHSGVEKVLEVFDNVLADQGQIEGLRVYCEITETLWREKRPSGEIGKATGTVIALPRTQKIKMSIRTNQFESVTQEAEVELAPNLVKQRTQARKFYELYVTYPVITTITRAGVLAKYRKKDHFQFCLDKFRERKSQFEKPKAFFSQRVQIVK